MQTLRYPEPIIHACNKTLGTFGNFFQSYPFVHGMLVKEDEKLAPLLFGLLRFPLNYLGGDKLTIDLAHDLEPLKHDPLESERLPRDSSLPLKIDDLSLASEGGVLPRSQDL